jgi:hypothetical protein
MWFWSIYDIAKSRFSSQTDHTIWLIAVLFAPVITVFAYLILRKKIIRNEQRVFAPDFNRL